MTPKPACHLFSFSLLSPLSLSVCYPPYCMLTHTLSKHTQMSPFLLYSLDVSSNIHIDSSAPEGSNRGYMSVSLPSPRPHVSLQQISGQRCRKSRFWRWQRRTKVCMLKGKAHLKLFMSFRHLQYLHAKMYICVIT